MHVAKVALDPVFARCVPIGQPGITLILQFPERKYPFADGILGENDKTCITNEFHDLSIAFLDDVANELVVVTQQLEDVLSASISYVSGKRSQIKKGRKEVHSFCPVNVVQVSRDFLSFTFQFVYQRPLRSPVYKGIASPYVWQFYPRCCAGALLSI